MEKLSELPPLAIIALGVTLAIMWGARQFGLMAGAAASPEKAASAATVAAVIVDPTALNRASSVLQDHTEVARDMIETLADLTRQVSIVAIELNRTREELRLERVRFNLGHIRTI